MAGRAWKQGHVDAAAKFKRKTVPLPGEPDSQERYAVLVFRIIGAAVFAVPPTRAFIAVAGDLVQFLVLLGAAVIPVWVVVASMDPGADGYFNQESTDQVAGVLEKMRARLMVALAKFCLAILVLIVAKEVCIWAEPHLSHRAAAVAAARLSAAISGAVVGECYTSLRMAASIHGHVQFLRGMAASTRFVGRKR